jgi:hypothetical protein
MLCRSYGRPSPLSYPASVSFAEILLNDRPRPLSRLASFTAAGAVLRRGCRPRASGVL